MGQVESVAVDQAGNVYVDGLVSVQVVTPEGTLNTIELEDPANMRIFVNNVYVEPQGVVYFTEIASHRVMKLENGQLTTMTGNGTRGFEGDGGPAVNAQLREPEGLVRDGDGNIYVADNGNRRIRKISSDGIITTVAGGGNDVLSNGVPATSVRFSEPSDVAIGPDGALYISERARDVIFRVENAPAAALGQSGKRQGILPGRRSTSSRARSTPTLSREMVDRPPKPSSTRLEALLSAPTGGSTSRTRITTGSGC